MSDYEKIQYTGIYANWCNIIMDKIEQIAKEKYPDTTYWIDTGSRCDVCMAMLEQFRKDIQK